MRFGIISDIHSNIEALRAVYRELCVAGCDRVICLGDIVGYGPSPCECIDFLRRHDIAAVKGNHDHYVSGREIPSAELHLSDAAFAAVCWTREQIDDDQARWLHHLPFSLVCGDILFIHAAIDTAGGEYWPYIFDARSAQFHFYCQETPLAFFGHVHVPLLISCREGGAEAGLWIEHLQSRRLPWRRDCKYLINPGSVGQPRHADKRGSAVVYDTERREVELVCARYDVDATCRKIVAAGLPEELAARLV